MRGANPDVECPRCSATFPPSESRLVTCVRCGLGFSPRELEHAPKAPVLPAAPERVEVRRDGTTLTITWRASVIPAAVLLAVMSLGLAVLAAIMRPSLGFSAVCIVCFLGFGYVTLTSLVDRHIVVIEPGVIAYRLVPLPLVRSRQLDRREITGIRTVQLAPRKQAPLITLLLGRDRHDPIGIVALVGERKQRLLATRNLEIATYVADSLAKLLGVPHDHQVLALG